MLRLAVELEQCDVTKWQDFQQMLLGEPPTPIDWEGLHASRQRVHALLRPFSGAPPVLRNICSRQTQARGEVTDLIEGGQARLARMNVFLRALWSESASTRKISAEQRTNTFNDVIGMMVGERQLNPELALTLFAALGLAIIGRARASPVGVPRKLSVDVSNLSLSSKGTLGEKSQQAAATVTALAALLRVAETPSNAELTAELAGRGDALQGELRMLVTTYSEDTNAQRVMQALGVAEDFIEHLPPDGSDHGPGNSQLDVMIHLLGVLTAR